MSSAILHIKDAYFFEVPKFLWPSRREEIEDFPEVWIRLDPDFQHWEAERLAGMLKDISATPVDAKALVGEWEHWQHAEHENLGRPLDVFLEMKHQQLKAQYDQWKSADEGANRERTFQDYLNATEPAYKWFAWQYEQTPFRVKWEAAKEAAGGQEAVEAYATQFGPWSTEKIEGYNHALSGKVLIPQPFGTLRNLHQPESGFCVSKFMILQVVISLLLVAAFSWVARRISTGERPRGRLWNLLEAFLLFVRDQIARPAMGKDGDRFVPLLWTMFFFILAANLFGMLPWAGAPTGSFAVTTALALVTFGTGVLFGVKKFGVIGFVLNQMPSMDLPIYIAVVIKPMILLIELLGLLIKHGVLAIRLLANMVAGHVVLLGIMGAAFGLAAMKTWAGQPVWQWSFAAVVVVAASCAFSLLELLVAFLQAYLFTFLSALFIHAATHHH